jgi:hypothetical protein
VSKRAVLLDRDNVVVAHLTYAEMDGYIAKGLVERLTPVRASTHKFRLLEEPEHIVSQVFARLEFDQTSLTASVSRANAGAAEVSEVLWARRLVHIWPKIGERVATLKQQQRRPKKRKRVTNGSERHEHHNHSPARPSAV